MLCFRRRRPRCSAARAAPLGRLRTYSVFSTGDRWVRNEAVMRLDATGARLSRVAGALAIAAGLTGLVAPAASATSMPSMSGWIRLAQLSPGTPAVDVYLYSFSHPHAKVVLHHVAYGTVSSYMRVHA